MKTLVNSLTCPIIAAPMAGGPSTPTLTDAAWRAGGFGFLAAGMLTPEALERQMRATTCPYGVNVFMPHDDPASFAPLYNYAARHGLSIDPTSVDSTDGWDAKMALILRAAGEGWGPRVVSFTFGLIDAATVAVLHNVEVEAWAMIARADAVDSAVAVGVEMQFMLDNVDAPAMYPHVNTLMGPLRKVSAASGDSTHVAAWAGSGFRHAREGSVDAIVQNLYPRFG